MATITPVSPTRGGAHRTGYAYSVVLRPFANYSMPLFLLIYMSDAGLDAVIIAQGDIPMSFLGAPVNVQISIASSYLTEMSWSLFGRPYLFSITRQI